MLAEETNKTGVLCDEDKTKEQLIAELRWYRDLTQNMSNELSIVENDNSKLTEELTNVKRALAANCEALKDAIGWHGYGI